MTLQEFLSRYILEHDLAKSTADQMRRTVRQFGGERSLSQVDSDAVNRWLVALQDSGLAKPTIKGKRGHLVTLLRAAHADGLCPAPERIRRPRCPHLIVRSWSADEARRLVVAAEGVEGWFPRTGVKRSDWWAAFVLTAWDSGHRLTDTLSLRWDQIEGDRLRVGQSKSGRVKTSELKPETLDRLAAIRQPERDLVFPWGSRREYFYRDFKRLVRRAGLDGTSKYLRRGGSTNIVANGGSLADAARHLGHSPGSGVDLVQRYYLDESKLPDAIPAPEAPPPIMAPSNGQRVRRRDKRA